MKMNRNINRIRFAAAALALLASAAWSQKTSKESGEKVEFASLLCRGESYEYSCERLTSWGYLFAKPGQNKLVIINHGSQGVDSRMFDYVDALQERGYAAFVADTWGARGLSTVYENYRESVKRGGNELNMIMDLFLAADMLRKRGFTKIGTLGESMGGGVAHMLHNEWWKRQVPLSYEKVYGTKFALAPMDASVGQYGPCNVRNESRDRKFDGKPVLLLLAELDDETPAKFCEAYVPWMNARGGNGSFTVIKGEHHSWDAPYYLTRSLGPHYAKCDIRVDEKGVPTDAASGFTMPAGGKPVDVLNNCKAIGYHTGNRGHRFVAFPLWLDFFDKTLAD